MILKWARIINNKVFEVIDFDPSNRFHPDIVNEFIPCNQDVQQHWIYDGTFKPNEKTQEELNLEELLVIKNDLKYYDQFIPRSIEDLLDYHILIGLYAENDLPIYLRNYKRKKQEMRTRMKEIGG